jgi:hypothetical protein
MESCNKAFYYSLNINSKCNNVNIDLGPVDCIAFA